MSYRSLYVAAFSLLLSFAVQAVASDYGEGNARVRLVASVGRAEAGGTFLLGVLFDIRPGWHVYWRNPGGAGLATDIQWRLPEGCEAGPLQWPVPVSFTQSGDIPGYGYIGSVVLASEVGVQQDIDEAFRATVGATVSWLACKDVCVIGEAELEASLAELPAESIFAAWSEDLPRDPGASEPPFNLTTRGSLAEGQINLWLEWRNDPHAVEWFPDPPESLKVDDIEVRTRGNLTRIDAVVQTIAGTIKKPNSLSSVVVMVDETGERRGWELAVDLTTSRP